MVSNRETELLLGKLGVGSLLALLFRSRSLSRLRICVRLLVPYAESPLNSSSTNLSFDTSLNRKTAYYINFAAQLVIIDCASKTLTLLEVIRCQESPEGEAYTG